MISFRKSVDRPSTPIPLQGGRADGPRRNLHDLPDELLARVLSYLSTADKLNVSHTSRRLYNLAGDPVVCKGVRPPEAVNHFVQNRRTWRRDRAVSGFAGLGLATPVIAATLAGASTPFIAAASAGWLTGWVFISLVTSFPISGGGSAPDDGAATHKSRLPELVSRVRFDNSLHHSIVGGDLAFFSVITRPYLNLDFNEALPNGKTPLHCALEAIQQDPTSSVRFLIMEALLKGGARVEPTQVAMANTLGHSHVARLLEKYLAPQATDRA